MAAMRQWTGGKGEEDKLQVGRSAESYWEPGTAGPTASSPLRLAPQYGPDPGHFSETIYLRNSPSDWLPDIPRPLYRNPVPLFHATEWNLDATWRLAVAVYRGSRLGASSTLAGAIQEGAQQVEE